VVDGILQFDVGVTPSAAASSSSIHWELPQLSLPGSTGQLSRFFSLLPVVSSADADGPP
jgi:hypothetical protein